MAYNPKHRQTYSLISDIDGKNQKEVGRMVPKILRKLAMGHIDLEKEGYKFLDSSFIGVITDVTYSQAMKYMWDYTAYDCLIKEIESGVYPFAITEQMYNIIKSMRNEKSSKYKAYKVANDGLLMAKQKGQLSEVVRTAQEMSSYSNFY